MNFYCYINVTQNYRIENVYNIRIKMTKKLLLLLKICFIQACLFMEIILDYF